MNELAVIDLDPDEHNQSQCHHPFLVNLGRRNGSWILLMINRIFFPNKTEDVNLK